MLDTLWVGKMYEDMHPSSYNTEYAHCPKSPLCCTDSCLSLHSQHGKSENECESHSVLCDSLQNPMDYTVNEILQARIVEWVGFPFSRGSSQPRDQNPTLQADSLPAEPQGKPRQPWIFILSPSLYCLHGFAFSGKSYSWEHTVCSQTGFFF